MRFGQLNTSTELGSISREEHYSGTTDASGLYTVAYAQSFSTVPVVTASIRAGLSTQQHRISASSTTGFTIHVYQRDSVNILGSDVLLSSTANVSGATVDVLVKEQ